MGELEGKVAIVTGAAAGIGAAAAERFALEGAAVMLVDRDEAGLRSVAQRLGAERAAFTVADVSAPDAVKHFVERTAQRFGGIDILFANAGVEGRVGPIEACPVAEFDRVMAVNVRGPFLAIQAVVPALAARGGGSIVVTSSIAGLVGSPGLAPYVTSKHAVLGLARAAALELAPRGIRVNVIHPGPIDNRMMRSIETQLSPNHPDDAKTGFEARVPLGRYGTNEEIAHLALFLVGARSSYCTGASFVADGGFVAQ